jgi:hypothetical protein
MEKENKPISLSSTVHAGTFISKCNKKEVRVTQGALF